jgi:hypothetical protein
MTDEYKGQVSVHKQVNDNPDSIEIGTPSKGGAIKVYGDFSKPEEFKKKISQAVEVRQYANAKLEVKIPGAAANV